MAAPIRIPSQEKMVNGCVAFLILRRIVKMFSHRKVTVPQLAAGDLGNQTKNPLTSSKGEL